MRYTLFGRSYESLEELAERVAELDAQYEVAPMPPAARDEWNALNELIDELQARRDRVDDLRRDRVAQAAGNSGATEDGTSYGHRSPISRGLQPLGLGDDTSTNSTGRAADPGRVVSRDAGLRTIEMYSRSGEMPSHAAAAMEQLVRDQRDPLALTARYLAAAGHPDYNSAFGKMLQYGVGAPLRFTPEEQAAVQRVNAVEVERGLITGVGSQGGFALPITIDPSIMLTSNGALNPIRQIARVINVTTTEWRGVTSAGVVASYDPEASEVSDDTPVLGQPVIFTEKAQAFVPFAIEVGQDWGSLQRELAVLVRDARDVLDAAVFYNGTGTDQPFGVRTGLTTSQRVQTAGAGAFAYGDVYLLKQAIRPRDIANATFAFHPNRVDDIWRFVAAGDATDATIMNEARDRILGKPAVEWTSIPTASTTGTTIGLYGDWRAAYTIIDRIGLSVEIVQHLFGANRRPTGERGFYAYWRTGAKVVVPEALRYLEAL